MKVTLISPPIMDVVDGVLRPIAMDEAKECPPYGIYLLHAQLVSEGFECKLIDLIQDGSNSIKIYENDISSSQLVGISTTSLSWPTAITVISQIRSINPLTKIVLGGIHATMFEDYIFDSQPIDFIIRGEGERAISELCKVLDSGGDLGSVENLTWIDKSGKINKNPMGEKIRKEELSNFPTPSFMNLKAGQYNGLSIESSRGCAFDCSFCSTSYRKSYRAMEPLVFVDKLESMLPQVNKTSHDMIHIIDDEFSLNPRRAIAIADEIRKRGLNVNLTYDSRANDLIFPGYVEAISDYTFQFLVGAECGYDEGLKLIGKKTTCELLEKAALNLYKAGISHKADFSFIIGLPWETLSEVKRTIEFAFNLLNRYGVRILLQWYVQIPGSRLWQSAREREIVNEAMYDDFGFFQNLYLHSCESRLTPSETWSITELVSQLSFVYSLRKSGSRMIEYSHPDPITINFPKKSFSYSKYGLKTLREVSKPPKVNEIKFVEV